MKNSLLASTLCALSIMLLMTLTLPVSAQTGAPLARITLPIRGQTLRGSVTVQGSATSPQFARFEVAYAPELDITNWTTINGAVQPVENGPLAVWNTRPLSDGRYALRLLVFSNDGTTTEIVVHDLILVNVAIDTTTTTTSAMPVSSTDVITSESIATFDLTANEQSVNLSEIPHAFTKGVTVTLYAFVALGAYLLLKKIVNAIIRRVLRRPADYGR